MRSEARLPAPPDLPLPFHPLSADSLGMATTKSSAMNGAALFASGAVVGTALYTMARSLMHQNTSGAASKASSEPSKEHGAERQAAHTTVTESDADEKKAAFIAAATERSSTAVHESAPPAIQSYEMRYNEYGVMGQAYEPRGLLSAVEPQDTHVPLGAAMENVPTVADAPDLSKNMLSLSLLVMEMLALEYSDTIFTYESGTSGFGAFCEAHKNDYGVVVQSMQTRAGAGQTIAGFLAGQGSSSVVTPSKTRSTVSVLTNAAGFRAMGPALTAVDAEHADLVVLVSGLNQGANDDLCVTNDYASTLATAAMLGDAGFEVVFSASRQEAVDVAKYAYARETKRAFVHIFDGAYSACEWGVLSPPTVKVPEQFSYTGPSSPETALIIPNGNVLLRARALLLTLPTAMRGKLGIVGVRQLRPWDAEALGKIIPQSVKTLRVIEEAFSATDGILYTDVLESVLSGELGRSLKVQSLTLSPGQALSANEWYALLNLAVSKPTPISLGAVRDGAAAANFTDLLSLSSSRLVTFFGSDTGVSVATSQLLSRTLFDASKHVRTLSRFDNYAASGAVRSDVVVSERQGVDVPLDVLTRDGTSHVIVVSEPTTILKGYNLLDALRENGTIIFNAANWTSEDVSSALCEVDKVTLAAKHATVLVIDAHGIAQSMLNDKASDATVDDLVPGILLASLAQAVPELANASLPRVSEHAQSVPIETWPKSVDALSQEDREKASKRGTHLEYNSTRASTADHEGDEQVVRASWALAAWQLMFREAYSLNDAALRPDLPEKTYNVKVSVNKRLTPLDYDRYLFHMELDTTGTDLKYEVGEALGVHGWNDTQEVEEFIEWSGFHPDELVAAPSVLHPGTFESRTVFQTLQQNLDIFGKPPKSFFEALGKMVTSRDEARWLRFISSGEGNSTFKKLSELETVTYVDVLHMFPSARVNMDWLVKNVEPIKPRHYSIASAQVAVGNSVHLLIVTVDWKTPHGSPRFGQCTRYLSALKPGTMVTVSIKPSVMKLPPLDTQPIIMAGLGTGAAPFRAFLQARAYRKSQGIEVGPMYYYFGSRHRAMEYLYGEELEAYLHDGLLTHLGLAFSRDQKQKVYIQHKIIEDGKQLVKFLMPEIDAKDGKAAKDGDKGLFTLCGPVWPVPDIQEALVQAFSEYGWSRDQAENKIAELKEDERYVLEVY